MITPMTQAAIAVLNDIYAGGDTARTGRLPSYGARPGCPAVEASKSRTYQTVRAGRLP